MGSDDCHIPWDLVMGDMSISLIVETRILSLRWRLPIEITHDVSGEMDISHDVKLDSIYNSGVTTSTPRKKLNFNSHIHVEFFGGVIIGLNGSIALFN